MVDVFNFVEAIALVPLASFVLVLLLGDRMPKKGAISGIAATGFSLAISLWVVLDLAMGGEVYHEELFTFVAGDDVGVELMFGLLIDPLAALMLTIVSLIAFLVHLFSLGYMNDEGEIGLRRYYASLSLFTFSMLAFVYSNNLLMAFMFFELVGLCSFLLIGFWFRDDGPPSAAKKAFLVTRFGDYFFLVGVVAVLGTFGTAAFAGEHSFIIEATHVLDPSHSGEMNTFFGLGEQAWITVIALLVLGGVVGKSAQFPLHTWLPDAMEGPTPVSALIHAATMVAAGVYLVMRMYGFYALSPTALSIIALIGGFTAFFAATMALVKQELKQVLAYSTVSQYGYMMLALGGGGYVGAVFHLTTHAIFKALLFLGAGAVIIAMHHNENMWDMGGLKSRMPVTYWTFLFGSLALAGIFPFAGFWSKDEVLLETLQHGLSGEPILLVGYGFGAAAVVLTALYTFRMVFLTFHGDPRTETAEDPEPIGWNMKFPLVVLGVLSAVAGVINLGAIKEFIGEDALFLKKWLEGKTLDGELGSLSAKEYHHILESDYAAGYEVTEISPLGPGALALVLALIGLGGAVALYRGSEPTPHMTKLGRVRTLLMNNYYLDEFQVWLATGLTAPLARAANKFDQSGIDGVVNGTGSVSMFTGQRFRKIQTGIVTNYAALLTMGLVLLLLVFALMGGWF
ncbi:NADH-quinone oxidoreductase subunit L [Halovenus rubra]|uniref:NADH-quinone oxidoreductase subunit L n=2 Tax=Halovenus rubra TaxID=869890 RepID=A0ACC7E401_9EURY|nr:NADH-quinone oxidoreductase subunit L [Halovenus rubra]